MILCVDPEQSSRERTVQSLLDEGFDVAVAESRAEARPLLDENGDLECLVTEYGLPDATGLELIAEVREQSPDAACILFTDVSLDDVDTAAFADVVAEYLDKDGPNATAELVDLVEHSLSFRSQTAYPLPNDETARLAALDRYGLSPEELEDAFDRLTELAAARFDVGSAAIGLVGETHERFLACHGVEFDTVAREDTVCTYAILDPDVTVIEDVRSDPRLEDHEGLLASDVRFYAGAPLLTPEGRAIGTFCVYHHEPRQFSAREREHLALFAAEAMEQLRLRRQIREADGGDADG